MDVSTPTLYIILRDFLQVKLGLSADSLLMCAGLGPMLITSLIFRRGLHSILPWLVVMGVVFLRELWHLSVDLDRFGHWRWEQSLHDATLTLFWPTVIWLGLNFRRPHDS